MRHYFDNFTDIVDTKLDAYCYENAEEIFICFPSESVGSPENAVIDFIHDKVYPIRKHSYC